MCYEHTVIQTDKRDIVKEIIDYENQAYKQLKSISDKRLTPVGKTLASDEPKRFRNSDYQH